MRVGTVKWFDYRRGYGFIIGPEGEEVMVHYAVIKSSGFRVLYHGEQVEFEAIRGPRGWQATAVRQFSNGFDVSATDAPRMRRFAARENEIAATD